MASFGCGVRPIVSGLFMTSCCVLGVSVEVRADVYQLPASCGPEVLEQTPWEGSAGAQFGLGCLVALPESLPTGALRVARAFSAGPGGLSIACVHAPVYSNSAAWPVTCSVWRGHPLDPIETHELLGTIEVDVPEVDLQSPLTLSFDFAAIGIASLPANEMFFVEISVASRDTDLGGDGGGIFIGCRSAAQSGSTYGFAPECGLPGWVALANPLSSVLIRVEGSEALLACSADLDADGVVGAADLAVLLGAWGQRGPADLNADGTIDAVDLATLIGAWGACG
jgi:hypothetical protein